MGGYLSLGSHPCLGMARSGGPMRVSAFCEQHLAFCPKSMPPGHKRVQKDKNTHWCYVITVVVQAHSTKAISRPYQDSAIAACCFLPNASCTRNSSRLTCGHKSTQLGGRSAPNGAFLPRIPGRGPECQRRLRPHFGFLMSPNREGAVSLQRGVVWHRRGASGNGHAMAVRMNFKHTGLATQGQ